MTVPEALESLREQLGNEVAALEESRKCLIYLRTSLQDIVDQLVQALPKADQASVGIFHDAVIVRRLNHCFAGTSAQAINKAISP